MKNTRRPLEAVVNVLAVAALLLAVVGAAAVGAHLTPGSSAPSQYLTTLVLGGLAGGRVAWWLHHRTALSPVNLYLCAAIALLLLGVIVVASLPVVVAAAFLPIAVAAGAAAVLGARWRREETGAAGELREHAADRAMAWERDRLAGRPRQWIGSLGELITERKWPENVAFVPMGSEADAGLVPRGEGHHILVLGGTGSGKTVSAGRITLARVLADGVPALVLDPKADEDLREQLAAAADHAGRPFIVFDPFDDSSDRWDPVWSSEPGRTVARLLAPIQTSEPYYADTLRIHLGVVAEALSVLGLWPASLPLLLEAAQAERFELLRDLVRARPVPPGLGRRVEEQAAMVSSRQGERDIASGAARLKVVTGTSFREVLTPRGDGRAVQLPSALSAGAVVLWRTHVEDIPEEAEAITTLALADMIATAGQLKGKREWLVVIDEFGSVLSGNAARRALGILGRARSAGGQAIVVTQSAADVTTATENPSMLESLSDNFSAFVIHRQTSAESREWVANLCGTRELWQSTDRTAGGGRFAEGTGSRRRAREFRVRPDELKELRVGQAYVWSPSGPAPSLVEVAMPPPLKHRAAADKEAAYADAGPKSLREYRGPGSVKESDGPEAAADASVEADGGRGAGGVGRKPEAGVQARDGSGGGDQEDRDHPRV